MTSLAIWQNALKERYRKKESVADLWFAAQSQLKAGRNPPILAKFNITLSNIRQHNPRFRDYQRRRSQHEKAATYLQVTGDKLQRNTIRRKEIEVDDDDWSETEGDEHDAEYHHDAEYEEHPYGRPDVEYRNDIEYRHDADNSASNDGRLYSAYNGLDNGRY